MGPPILSTEHDINHELEDDDDIQSATSSQLHFEQNGMSNEHEENEISDLLPAYSVTTGAVVPNFCNAVTPIEHVAIHQTPCHPADDDIVARNTSVTLLSTPPSEMSDLPDNRWARQPGSDLASDALLLPPKILYQIRLQSGVVPV